MPPPPSLEFHLQCSASSTTRVFSIVYTPVDPSALGVCLLPIHITSVLFLLLDADSIAIGFALDPKYSMILSINISKHHFHPIACLFDGFLYLFKNLSSSISHKKNTGLRDFSFFSF